MRRLLLLLCCLLPMMTAAEILPAGEQPADWAERALLRVTFLETGRSDAILVECGGEAMLIDGGDASWAQALRSDLETRGLTAFRYFLNTHPHNDHIEGLTALIKGGVLPERFLSPYAKDYTGDSCHTAAVRACWDKGVIWRLISHGDVFTLGGAQLHILCTTTYAGPNARCAVVLITYGDSRILLTGDLTGEAQKSLLKLCGAQALQAEIVKAPHHGKNAMVGEFLTAVNPALIICTAERRESPALITQADARQLPLLFSGEGEITLETDGVTWYVHQGEKRGRDRWKAAPETP